MEAATPPVVIEVNVEEQVSKTEFDDLFSENPKISPNSATCSASQKTYPTCSSITKVDSGTGIVIFQSSDINAAVRHVYKATRDPAVVLRIYVQEAIEDKFQDALMSLIYEDQARSSSYNFTSSAVTTPDDLDDERSIANLIKNTEQIKVASSSSDRTSYDLTAATRTVGMSSTQSFRTTKEVNSLIGDEQAPFDNLSIWHQNHSVAYEIVMKGKARTFYLNSYEINVDLLDKVPESANGCAYIKGRYHFERLMINGQPKNVVFPVGSIFAN